MKSNYIYTLIISSIFLFTSGITRAAENIVLVNGKAISKNQVQHFISKQPKKTNFQQSIQEMINVELLVQQAEKEKLLDEDSLQLELERTRNAIIASEYLKKVLSDFKITNDDLKKRYQQQYVNGPEEFEYNANHILLKTEDEAKDLIKQLNDGSEFTELAKKHSTGPSGKNGGSLGWFKRTTMVKPFADATVAMEKGKISQSPVKTQFGWHIIQLNDKRKVEALKFNTVERKIRTELSAEKISSIIKGLRDAATIKLAE